MGFTIVNSHLNTYARGESMHRVQSVLPDNEPAARQGRKLLESLMAEKIRVLDVRPYRKGAHSYVELRIQSLLRITRIYLLESKLRPEFWPLAANHGGKKIDRSRTRHGNGGESPVEKFGCAARVQAMREKNLPFGTPVAALTSPDPTHPTAAAKMLGRSEAGAFVGFDRMRRYKVLLADGQVSLTNTVRPLRGLQVPKVVRELELNVLTGDPEEPLNVEAELARGEDSGVKLPKDKVDEAAGPTVGGDLETDETAELTAGGDLEIVEVAQLTAGGVVKNDSVENEKPQAKIRKASIPTSNDEKQGGEWSTRATHVAPMRKRVS